MEKEPATGSDRSEDRSERERESSRRELDMGSVCRWCLAVDIRRI
jgi:hypothetical protein